MTIITSNYSNLFNEYFTNIGKELAESIPQYQKHYHKYLNGAFTSSFFMMFHFQLLYVLNIFL